MTTLYEHAPAKSNGYERRRAWLAGIAEEIYTSGNADIRLKLWDALEKSVREGGRFMKKLVILVGIIAILGCAVTQTSSIRKGAKDELVAVKSVYIDLFKCQCEETIPLAIQNSIIEIFLPHSYGIKANRNDADVIIEGIITITDDSQSGGAGSIGQAGGIFASSSGSGRYVSGVTARVINKKGDILAIASATQVRTSDWIPDPPPVVGRWAGEKLIKVLQGNVDNSGNGGF